MILIYDKWYKMHILLSKIAKLEEENADLQVAAMHFDDDAAAFDHHHDAVGNLGECAGVAADE